MWMFLGNCRFDELFILLNLDLFGILFFLAKILFFRSIILRDFSHDILFKQENRRIWVFLENHRFDELFIVLNLGLFDMLFIYGGFFCSIV